MKILTCVVAATFITFAGAQTAFADAEAGQGYFSVMGSYLDDDKDRNVTDGVNTGQFGMGYAVNDILNIEGFVSATAAKGSLERPATRSIWVSALICSVFSVAQSASARTCTSALATCKYDPAGPVSNNDGAMYSAGAGFLLDLFESNVSLRGEYRHRMETTTSQNLNDDIFSLGLQIPFGAGTPAFVDSDGDGVEDGMDRCPNTPAGTRVDGYGCETDSDGDGVKDSKDKCPNTPRGVAVNADGCPMDSDGDGVADDMDKCPNTVAGAKVDADGCELDGDKDGVVDRLDECPNSAPGVQVDIKGCEIKERIRLPGVNFESNSDRLLPSASGVLNDAAATLNKNPTIKVVVAGHTDSDGAAAYNESLSARRATTVRDYLASKGVAMDRMTTRGYGESEPIADNGTREGKAQNRRVTLRIVER